MIYHMNLHLMFVKSLGKKLYIYIYLFGTFCKYKFIHQTSPFPAIWETAHTQPPRNDIGQAPHRRSLGTSRHTDNAWETWRCQVCSCWNTWVSSVYIFFSWCHMFSCCCFLLFLEWKLKYANCKKNNANAQLFHLQISIIWRFFTPRHASP